MKDKKSKVYFLLVLGISIFSLFLVLFLNNVLLAPKEDTPYLNEIHVANNTVNSVDIFWKGNSFEKGFKLGYVEDGSSGKYNQESVNEIYFNKIGDQEYMYLVKISGLEENSSYVFEIVSQDEILFEGSFMTEDVKDEILAPDPLSGSASPFDWVLINSSRSILVRADHNGEWVVDRNLLDDDYTISIYSRSIVSKEEEILSTYNILPRVYASDVANCDEISYPYVASHIKGKVDTAQNILQNVQAYGESPQYKRCYQDVYCEAEKVGMDARWTLTNWMHESNASDYGYRGAGAQFRDFGVLMVPPMEFQGQLGFFLSLSHDPCNCGSSCSKEEYYCCWANNYHFGTQNKVCSEATSAYLQSLLAYYNTASSQTVREISGLPMPLKSSPRTNVNCGNRDPIAIYNAIREDGSCDKITSATDCQTSPLGCQWVGMCIPDGSGGSEGGGGSNDGGGGSSGGEEEQEENLGGICCALKITGKENLQGDFENITDKSCSQIWQVGRSVYGGKIEYSVEIPNTNRSSCEKEWSGVCCNISGEYKWVPSSVCSKRDSNYTDSESCLLANEEAVSNTYNLKNGFNVIGWDIVTQEDIYALDLLANNSILLVASFNEGIWDNIVYKDGGQTKGNNFKFEAGRGYLITTDSDLVISFSGRKLSNFSFPNYKGWMLMTSSAFDPYSSTKDIVLSFSEVDVYQIGLWDTGLGRFEYYVYDVSGTQYGESKRIEDNQGVFIKVK